MSCLSLPLTDSGLETRLGVDVDRNLRDAPGVRVWRAGFNNSGVSNNNRMVERHKSIDTERIGRATTLLAVLAHRTSSTYPLNFTHDGGEVIFNLPNRLQAYYLGQCNRFPIGRSTDKHRFQSRCE